MTIGSRFYGGLEDETVGLKLHFSVRDAAHAQNCEVVLVVTESGPHSGGLSYLQLRPVSRTRR
jgi:hypothetical protein